jgi:hypothetical protein
MKRATFRIDSGRAGLLQTTIAPVTEKQHASFGTFLVIVGSTLLLLTVAAAKLVFR